LAGSLLKQEVMSSFKAENTDDELVNLCYFIIYEQHEKSKSSY